MLIRNQRLIFLVFFLLTTAVNNLEFGRLEAFQIAGHAGGGGGGGGGGGTHYILGNG